MQQYDELSFLNINWLFHVHRAMTQVHDVVSANFTFTGLNLTSEYFVIFTITPFVNRPIPYLVGSVCSAKVIYLGLSIHLGNFAQLLALLRQSRRSYMLAHTFMSGTVVISRGNAWERRFHC
jgi:hypothetical protein